MRDFRFKAANSFDWPEGRAVLVGTLNCVGPGVGSYHWVQGRRPTPWKKQLLTLSVPTQLPGLPGPHPSLLLLTSVQCLLKDLMKQVEQRGQPCFTGEETEAQRRKGACPKVMWLVTERPRYLTSALKVASLTTACPQPYPSLSNWQATLHGHY